MGFENSFKKNVTWNFDIVTSICKFRINSKHSAPLKKWNLPLKVPSTNMTKSAQFSAGLVTFTEKIVNGKFLILCRTGTLFWVKFYVKNFGIFHNNIMKYANGIFRDILYSTGNFKKKQEKFDWFFGYKVLHTSTFCCFNVTLR